VSDSYTGILDQEAGVIESMASNAFAPMVLPFIFIMVPVIVSVITGLLINFEEPRWQAGEWGWGWLAVLYPLETRYVVIKWKESLKNPWLTIRYWVGKRYWENDFQVISWEIVGRANEKDNPIKDTAPTRFGLIKKPVHEDAGDLIIEYNLRSKLFPKLLAAQKEIPERMLSFVGNIGLVQNGGLLFESRNMACCSFVRTDFTKDDVIEFIPIGVITDCSMIAQDIADGRKISLPSGTTLAEAGTVRDQHYASLYKRKWIDEARIRENQSKQEVDLDVKVDERVAATVDAMVKSGQVPLTGGGPPTRFKFQRSYLWWILGVTAISIVIVWRILVH
jgi:hypothetical protein